MPPILKLMRPGDWVKNVFVLPALVFALPSQVATGANLPPLFVQTALAFVAFCLVASGFYAINDVMDVEKDRLHPVKRKRPVASGDVSRGRATGLGLGLIAASLIVASLINGYVVLVVGAYALLQVAYNLRLKRAMFVDVMALATGFAMRATAGALAISVQISVWLLLCVFFLCVYLGFIKRLCDLASAGAESGSAWKSPAGYDDRLELSWLLGVSAVLAIVTYLMYALSSHAWTLFGSRSVGFALLTPFVMIAIHRFYHRASAGSSDSPLAALREDRAVLASVVLFAVGVGLILLFPPVQAMLDHLFVAGAGAESARP